jgi:hypothetical protein
MKVLPEASYAALIIWAIAGPLLFWRVASVRNRNMFRTTFTGTSILSSWADIRAYNPSEAVDAFFDGRHGAAFCVTTEKGHHIRVEPEGRVVVEQSGSTVIGSFVDVESIYGTPFLIIDVNDGEDLGISTGLWRSFHVVDEAGRVEKYFDPRFNKGRL